MFFRLLVSNCFDAMTAGLPPARDFLYNFRLLISMRCNFLSNKYLPFTAVKIWFIHYLFYWRKSWMKNAQSQQMVYSLPCVPYKRYARFIIISLLFLHFYKYSVLFKLNPSHREYNTYIPCGKRERQWQSFKTSVSKSLFRWILPSVCLLKINSRCTFCILIKRHVVV